MSRLQALVLLTLAVAATYYALAWSLQRAIVFPRYLPRYAKEPSPPPGVEVLRVASPAGPVEGWFFPAPGASATAPRPAVICAHGNAEVIDRWVEEARRYQALGFHVLLPEYRGYGRSAGRPSQAAIAEDFPRFYDWVAARPDVDRERIVFHGRSLGVAAVLGLAVARPPRALILQSGFTSVVELARGYLMPRVMVRDPFDNLAALRATTAPVLILHGERDTIIPPEHARALAAAAGPRARLVLMSCDHNDCPPDGELEDFWAGIEGFLRDAGAL